jgi:biotin transporter BioY
LLWRWSRDESAAFLARMASGLLGLLAVYALGWVGLVTVTGMGWGPALANGVVQFVPVDLAKVFVAAGATSLLVPPRRSGEGPDHER